VTPECNRDNQISYHRRNSKGGGRWLQRGVSRHGRRHRWPDRLAAAPEARQKVAHGETVGLNAPTNKAPDGAKEFSAGDFLPPLPGLEIVLND